jgi:hypothetical protein
MLDFKTIADLRKDNGDAIRKDCREFVVLCRRLELLSEPCDRRQQVQSRQDVTNRIGLFGGVSRSSPDVDGITVCLQIPIRSFRDCKRRTKRLSIRCRYRLRLYG